MNLNLTKPNALACRSVFDQNACVYIDQMPHRSGLSRFQCIKNLQRGPDYSMQWTIHLTNVSRTKIIWIVLGLNPANFLCEQTLYYDMTYPAQLSTLWHFMHNKYNVGAQSKAHWAVTATTHNRISQKLILVILSKIWRVLIMCFQLCSRFNIKIMLWWLTVVFFPYYEVNLSIP